MEGRCCPLAAFGCNRDRKRGKSQIVCGLLSAADSCPLAIEVFAGNTADPTTVHSQVQTLRGRFGVERIALVEDHGMLATTCIREDLEPVGLDWISALKSSDLRLLLRSPLRPAELVPDQVGEIVSADLPGERLRVCLNPFRRSGRGRRRRFRRTSA